MLVKSLVTPNELFFVRYAIIGNSLLIILRNHLPVPIVNPKDYVLEITADTLEKPVKLTLGKFISDISELKLR
jgi:hypothetical protein